MLFRSFSFNPGEPVLGTTSLLWVLVLAGSYIVTHSVVFISKFWGVIFFLGAVYLTYRICLLLTPQKNIAFLGVLTFALSPPIIFGAVSGMEISLATLLLCLTLFFHQKEMGKKQKIFFAPVFGALSFAARPELILLYPLLLLHDYVNLRNKRGPVGLNGNISVIWRKLVVFILFLVSALVLSYAIAGSFLPNTFAAKTLDSGLIWAVKNGNLPVFFISVTLNPFIWGGTMLATLVCLNIFWAFFWGRGLVLSFLKKETFIYPLVFLLVPVSRGIIAPVSNSIFGEHRYVSFLLPLLAVFFVTGWDGLKPETTMKTRKASSRKWFYALGGVALVLAFVLYLHPLVRKDDILRFFSGYYFTSIQERVRWHSFAGFKFIFWVMIAFIAFVNLLGTTKLFTRPSAGSKVIYSLLIVGLILQIGFLVNRSERYALSVKNINQMQVHLGTWMKLNIPPGSLVAINDVGAIKFFGDRQCLDLEGLVSPEIIPYKILGEESYIVYLNKHRPDYFMIFPAWYPVLSEILALDKKIRHEIKLPDNIVCGGGGYVIVAQADWEFFDSTFQETELLNLKPNLPKKSLKRRWYDSQERQGLFPDWRVYQAEAGDAEIRHELKEAEKLYQKAESYDPQHHGLYMQMALFYQKIGDPARAKKAFENVAKHELFPLLSTFFRRESRK